LAKGKYGDKMKTLGLSSVNGYVNAMISLHKQHQLYDESLKLVEARGTLVNKITDTLGRETAQKERDEYADRVIGTINDGYSAEEYKKLGEYYMGESNNSTKGSRDRLCFLMGHAILGRSEMTLKIEFADLSCLRLVSLGATPCFALVVLIKFGKKKQVR
jgi:hypothetical protein